MPTFGRMTIYTDHDTVDISNIADVLKSAIAIHNVNKNEIKHLQNVYRGNQAILAREKPVRPEINNKCVINHANEIVSFKVSYLLSEPIIYVHRGTDDQSESINRLNEYMHIASKSARDKEIADDFNICGVAYRMVLPNKHYHGDVDEAPFEIYTLPPEDTFVVRYSGVGHPVVCGVTTVLKRIGPMGNISSPVYCVYTPNEYFEIEDLPTMTVSAPVKHGLNMVPIFEYINNNARLGSFEIVETLLDAMNTLASNRLDATEQAVQSLMIFKNCDIDGQEFDAMRSAGAIKLFTTGDKNSANVEMITSDLKQADQQVLMDSLYKTVLSITGMPAQSSENKSDSSNNGAVFMRAGWYSADARAKDSELLWRESENQFLRLVLRICRDLAHEEIHLTDVAIKFTRRNYEDILAKAQTLRMLLESGIDPIHSIAQSGLFSDPTEVYKASEPYLSKWLMTEPKEDGDE